MTMEIEHRVNRLEDIVADIRDRLSRMESRMDSQFRWILGVTITMWTTTMFGIVATLVATVFKS